MILMKGSSPFGPSLVHLVSQGDLEEGEEWESGRVGECHRCLERGPWKKEKRKGKTRGPTGGRKGSEGIRRDPLYLVILMNGDECDE